MQPNKNFFKKLLISTKLCDKMVEHIAGIGELRPIGNIMMCEDVIGGCTLMQGIITEYVRLKNRAN